MDADDIPTLQAQFDAESRDCQIVLDLTDLNLLDRHAVRFLGRCEAENIKLMNCRAYIREWIERERKMRADEPHVDTPSAQGNQRSGG